MAIIVYDLNNVLLPLEREVILRVLDLDAFLVNRQTVEYHKTCWVRSRLWKLKGIPVANDPRFPMDAVQVGKIENLARHLEQEFYSSIPIDPTMHWMFQHEWTVELLYNSLFLKTNNLKR